jgi:hypothetical protein
MSLVQHAAHGGDGGASHRPRLPAPAGAPVGAVGAQAPAVLQMLDHIGVQSAPPCIAPARGPPMWEDCDAQRGEGAQVEPDWANDWAGAAQPALVYEIDQRINW